MKYSRLPENAFKVMQKNVGLLLTNFDTQTGEIEEDSILGATTDSVTFEASTEYVDQGEDLNGCPKNMLEFMDISTTEAKLSGTFVSVTPKLAKINIGAADIVGETKIVPRKTLSKEDFIDIWWVSDYSSITIDGENDGKAGIFAVHIMNALSTAGFKITAEDETSGKIEFEYTAHYSLAKQDTVPYEIYIIPGKADSE